jgi:hypothetical protein
VPFSFVLLLLVRERKEPSKCVLGGHFEIFGCAFSFFLKLTDPAEPYNTQKPRVRCVATLPFRGLVQIATAKCLFHHAGTNRGNEPCCSFRLPFQPFIVPRSHVERDMSSSHMHSSRTRDKAASTVSDACISSAQERRSSARHVPVDSN